MLNVDLFKFLSPREAKKPGDKASSKACFFWAVEAVRDVGFVPVAGGWTREEARQQAREIRSAGYSTRVVPYKACLDRRGRHNRQVKSERLDA